MARPSIVYMGNNKNGYRVLKWLLQQGERVVALGVHAPERAKYRGEMLSLCAGEIFVFDDHQLETPEVAKHLRELEPDWLISVSFGRIIPPYILEIPTKGAINLHPSYLPYNRGSYPNVWPIIDGTPAGVTLHVMDAGLDTGQIIAQKKVEVFPEDTGETLYTRLEDQALALFTESWPGLVSGALIPKPQASDPATYHRVDDVAAIEEIDLDEAYRAADLINAIRARTFPPYEGAYFRKGGRRYFLELKITPEVVGE